MYDTPKSEVKEVSHDASQSAQNSKVNSHKMGEGTEPTPAENSMQAKETLTPNANASISNSPSVEHNIGKY